MRARFHTVSMMAAVAFDCSAPVLPSDDRGRTGAPDGGANATGGGGNATGGGDGTGGGAPDGGNSATGGGAPDGGNSAIVPGSMTFSYSGAASFSPAASTYTFVVPNHTTLTVKLWGGGGGESFYCNADFALPTLSLATTFGSLTAGSGHGGVASSNGTCTNYTTVPDGAGGIASGGSINTNGNPGAAGLVSASHGATACVEGFYTPGGGIDGGGAGAYVEKTYVVGDLAVGSSIKVAVSPYGANSVGVRPCYAGAGRVEVSWQ
jgi:hypothetical protein